MKTRYSVVIPHYESAQMLGRMLKSIPERDDIQIIVVDDCSSLKCQDELRLLQHCGLELVFQKENRGAGAARNVGLKYVKGEWVIAVDADDFFSKDAFDVFDKNLNLSYDYLMFCMCYYDPKTNQVVDGGKNVSNQSNIKFLNRPTKANFRRLKLKSTVCYNKLVRSDFLREKNIQFEECAVNNDVLYAYEVSLFSNRMKLIPDALYIKEIVYTGITAKKRDLDREFMFYLQAQKRNGLFDMLGIRRYPFYRSDFLYALFLLKKRGLKDTISFFKMRISRKKEAKEAFEAYRGVLSPITLREIDEKIVFCEFERT